MSDFFSKFKSVFIVEDPATTGTKPAESAPQATVNQPVETQAPVVASGGSLNDRFVDILASALEKNNQPGFDYFEFRQSLRNLAKIPMDEGTRFQSAFAAAQTMGVTQQQLIESAKFYINVLGQEQSRFNEAHAQQRAKLIGNREEEVKNLEAAIQQKSDQIRQLNEQIEQHKKQGETIRKEINDSTVKIETTRADFDVTFSSVVSQLNEDIAKMQQYLK